VNEEWYFDWFRTLAWELVVGSDCFRVIFQFGSAERQLSIWPASAFDWKQACKWQKANHQA